MIPVIDKEFQSLIPPLFGAEFEQLEENILQEGIRDALVIWRGVLLDGHNRFAIASKHGLSYETAEVDLPDRDAALMWIVRNQLGRRNLTPQQASYLRGKWYLREQIGHGGDRNSKYQNDTLKGDTAERISKETGVSRPTIARDAQYAEAVDKIADALGEDARASILASEVRLTKQDIKQAAGLLDSAPDLFEQVKTGALSIPAAIKELRPHVANNSGNNEWYTPPEYIEAARAVMGGIDTDPASSAVANQTVKAGVYFDREYDGLRREWHGRLWLNPPYSQPEIGDFCAKLVAEIDGGRVRQAITLTNNATETGWFRVLAERCTAVCFPASRIRFLDAQGNANGAPLQGQAVMYFGNRTDMFAREFARFGLVFYAR